MNSDSQAVNILKGLVIDGVSKAKSGHPGGAMSSMDFAYLLFTEYLKLDPKDPNWLGRDRFILSAGHESMLIYSILHQVGWLEMSELKNFRQLHSKTPGHPENFLTPGVECTTGPLGQGAAMSIGMAVAGKHFGARLDSELFNNKTWVLLGDGCMQEGVTLGAASMAGHLKLDNLVWFYDKNNIQISGQIDRSVSDDHKKIFEGFGWDVVEVNGHDHDALRKAMDLTKTQRSKPLLIIGETVIAKGAASVEGSHKTHGAPFKPEEVLATKKKMELPTEESFYAPEESKKFFRRNFDKRAQEVSTWKTRLEEKLQDKAFKKLFDTCFLEQDFSNLPSVEWSSDKKIATRNAFGDVIAKWSSEIPNLVGGSADLEPSNMTGAFAELVGDFTGETPENRNFAFGVREFPMSAACNGMALFGGLIPFDATFLSFADYSRPALRLGSLQKTRVIHEFTHDSFYLGEDGPTHQPVEHIMSLRLIPDFYAMRPADAHETEIMLKAALEINNANSALLLSRQGLPLLDIERSKKEDAAKGAYTVYGEKDAEIIFLATGAEVSLAIAAAKKLSDRKIRVVSMPCWKLFEKQSTDYKDSIIPKGHNKIVSIEAGSTLGWQRYTGRDGLNIGLDRFGDSAPAAALEVEYGFTPDQVADKVTKWVSSL